MRNKKVQVLVEMAVAIAISLVLNKLTLFKMPQGGSITLEMLPLLFISLRWGVGAGVFAGLGEGLLQLLFDGYVVHPAQLLLDYPVAFALIGLAGLFKTAMSEENSAVKVFFGSFLGVLGRFACHVISGAIFFGEYAPEGQNVWLYSAIYNGTYLIPSFIICIVVLFLVKYRFDNVFQNDVAA